LKLISEQNYLLHTLFDASYVCMDSFHKYINKEVEKLSRLVTKYATLLGEKVTKQLFLNAESGVKDITC